MKLPSNLLVAIILSAPMQIHAQQTSQTTLPGIPAWVESSEREAIGQAGALLAKGQFERAGARIKQISPREVVQVYVDWTPVPKSSRAAYREAVELAIHGWNQSLAGMLQFRLAKSEDVSDLTLLFDRVVAIPAGLKVDWPCFDVDITLGLPETKVHRTGIARIAVNVSNRGYPHEPYSISHLAGRAMGAYLGLPESFYPNEIMGPDSHEAAVAQKPATSEVARARELQRLRMAILNNSTRRVAASIRLPMLKVDKTEIDAGNIWRGGTGHYQFCLKNTGTAQLEIMAKPSCGCTVANYDKLIPAGGQGKIIADLHTGGFRGPISKLITVTSNDPETPQINLTLKATVKSLVNVLPNEVLPVKLKGSGGTVQVLTLQVQQKEPVTFGTVVCSVPYATAKVEPEGKETPSGREYTLSVAIDPAAPVGRSSFIITAQCSVKLQPVIRVTALCEKGIIAGPPSIYLGSISQATPMPLHQTITLTKSDGAFHVQSVENGDPSLKIRQEIVNDGMVYRLFVDYAGGWPAGNVQRKIVVLTDDPAQPRIEIPVIASVVDASSTK